MKQTSKKHKTKNKKSKKYQPVVEAVVALAVQMSAGVGVDRSRSWFVDGDARTMTSDCDCDCDCDCDGESRITSHRAGIGPAATNSVGTEADNAPAASNRAMGGVPLPLPQAYGAVAQAIASANDFAIVVVVGNNIV